MTVIVPEGHKYTIPRIRNLSGGGNFYGGVPGLVVANFNPEGPDVERYLKNLPDGTLIISLGVIDPDNECTFTCDVRLYIKTCSTCDTPTIAQIFPAATP